MAANKLLSKCRYFRAFGTNASGDTLSNFVFADTIKLLLLVLTFLILLILRLIVLLLYTRLNVIAVVAVSGAAYCFGSSCVVLAIFYY